MQKKLIYSLLQLEVQEVTAATKKYPLGRTAQLSPPILGIELLQKLG
jgi:hypothetical protein